MEVMALAVQRLGGVVAGVVETSELQLVRRRAARRAVSSRVMTGSSVLAGGEEAVEGVL